MNLKILCGVEIFHSIFQFFFVIFIKRRFFAEDIVSDAAN